MWLCPLCPVSIRQPALCRSASALSGMGIAYVPNSLADDLVAAGALQLVLDDWSPFFDGYFLYYPTRRQNLPVFRLIMEALRHRGG